MHQPLHLLICKKLTRAHRKKVPHRPIEGLQQSVVAFCAAEHARSMLEVFGGNYGEQLGAKRLQ